MNYDPTLFPPSPATDSRAVFEQLGYFWRHMFKDRTALDGLLQSITSGAAQNYTDMLNIISSYSAAQMPAFDTVNWYPLTIQSSQVNDTMVYGEGAVFGQFISGTPFVYGGPYVSRANVYSVLVPSDLLQVSIVADKIINPRQVWVQGENMQLNNGRMYFIGHPFTSITWSASTTYSTGTLLLDGNGNLQQAVYGGTSGSSAPTWNTVGLNTRDGTVLWLGVDPSITLWCYNAQTDSNNLYNNAGFLFGINLAHNEQSKKILANMVNIVANGASITNLQNLCVVILGLQHAASSVVSNRIQLYDNSIQKLWWQSNYSISNGSSSYNLPLYLPPTMFVANFDGLLRFDNSNQTITKSGTTVSFPVTGNSKDVALFNSNINSDGTFYTKLTNYMTLRGSSWSGNTSTINPVDFIFTNILGSATTLLHLKFNNWGELQLFQTVFQALQPSLPKHIWLLILCEITAASETYALSSSNYTENPMVNTYYPLNDTGVQQEYGNMNTMVASHGLLVKDMVSIRAWPSGSTTQDLRCLSFTNVGS